MTQAQCGNKTCRNNPDRCAEGCVCCVYGNGNSCCMPPGNCGTGDVITCASDDLTYCPELGRCAECCGDTDCAGIGETCGASGAPGVCGCTDDGTVYGTATCGTATNNCGAQVTCGPSCAITFGFTGAEQTYTVPTGVTRVRIDAFGIEGGQLDQNRSGLGGRAGGTVAVTPGQQLHVNRGLVHRGHVVLALGRTLGGRRRTALLRHRGWGARRQRRRNTLDRRAGGRTGVLRRDRRRPGGTGGDRKRDERRANHWRQRP